MSSRLTRSILNCLGRILCGLLIVPVALQAQNSGQRVFPQSKAAVERTLKAMQGTMSGRLPVLDGFANPGEHPLDRYERGFFQAEVEVSPTANGSVVKISVKVTAWYQDPAGSHSGYQLLQSNGRIEGDILDQLQEELAKTAPSPKTTTTVAELPPQKAAPAVRESSPVASSPEPSVSAPSPQFPTTDQSFSSSLKNGISNAERQGPEPPDAAAAAKAASSQEAELESLKEVFKNMAHPKNLIAVKKSGTPVVEKPSLTAKTEFLASMHDEFELLNFNQDWVHVRISGLSRGWIWRDSVEMPDGISDTDSSTASALTPAADLFHVVREETAPFPGDWAPLRTKYVKVVTVQKIDEGAKEAGPKERLEFAKFLLDKGYKEIVQRQELQGVVIVFDSADGGMIAATTATLQQWKAGSLSDAAFWHQCFFDPPEIFDSTASSGSK
ncbi:MAG TPA: hypothetical protein VMB66_12375 [Candidatus Acidoferrales bacterium]|nr:hypothetical protein [Candidatus Acidoferrales bacterium]